MSCEEPGPPEDFAKRGMGSSTPHILRARFIIKGRCPKLAQEFGCENDIIVTDVHGIDWATVHGIVTDVHGIDCWFLRGG